MPDASASAASASSSAATSPTNGADLEVRLDQVWRVLSLNQDLIRSADLRAYLLSFMSTMLVTYVANNLDKIAKVGSLQAGLLIVFFVAAVVFFAFSLTTLSARSAAVPNAKGFVFYGDIASRADHAAYVAECRDTDLREMFDDLNRQAYHVATIAKRKYATYRLAWLAVLAEFGSFLAIEISIALLR